MKNNRSITLGLILFSLLAIVVLVGSLLNVRMPAPASPTPAATPIPSLTPTPDPCAEENIEMTIKEFDKLSRQFSDRFVLAQNTPAAQLATVIAEMQDIRRTAEDYTVPACLDVLKGAQLGFMNSAIEASLTLYSSFSGDPTKTMTEEQVKAAIAMVQQRMGEATEFSSEYTAELARLLGIPLPTPTLMLNPGAGTPTVTVE